MVCSMDPMDAIKIRFDSLECVGQEEMIDDIARDTANKINPVLTNSEYDASPVPNPVPAINEQVVSPVNLSRSLMKDNKTADLLNKIENGPEEVEN